MAVSFKRPYDGTLRLDGNHSVDDVTIYSNYGVPILKANQDYVRVTSLQFYAHGRHNRGGEWEFTASDTFLRFGYGHQFTTDGKALHDVMILSGGDDYIDAYGAPYGENEFDNQRFQNFLRFNDKDGSYNGFQWSFAMAHPDVGTRDTLCLFAKDKGGEPYYCAHAFAPQNFYTRGVVIKPDQQVYNAGGGAGTRDRINYIRFDYGRQWCISAETNDESGGVANDGGITGDALIFRCGVGGDDNAVMNIQPDGVAARILHRHFDNEDTACESYTWPIGSMIWNAAKGELWFKGLKTDGTGWLIKIGAEASSEPKNNLRGHFTNQFNAAQDGNDGVELPDTNDGFLET